MANINIDKRGVPRTARNGRIYMDAGTSSSSSSSSSSSAPVTELLPTDNILEWDETSKSYKPYADRIDGDEWIKPYFYEASGVAFNYPVHTLPVYLDGSLTAFSLEASKDLAGGNYVTYFLNSENGIGIALYNGVYKTFSIKHDSSGALVLSANSGTTSDKIYIGSKTASGSFHGEHILIDDFLQTFTLNMSHVLFPKISAKTTPVDADLVLLIDSADSSRTKKVTFANLKAALQSYFDPIYGLFGSAVYNEINIGGLQLFRAGTNDPTIYSAGGLLLPVFSGSVLNELFFEITLPANYKPGTAIYPMVSWMPMTSPGTTQQVFWQLDYEWVNVGDVLTGTPSTKQYAHLTGTSGFKHIRAGLGTITGTGKTASSALICRFFRDPANVNDYYTDGAGLISVGLKYQINAVGSAS